MKRYSEPKIYSSKDLKKQWYVYFYWDKSKTSIKYYGLNSYKTFKERMFQAESLCEALKLKLDSGWNPIENTYEKGIHEAKFMLISEALYFALEKKKSKISECTFKNYKSTLDLINPSIMAKFSYFKITEITRKHILEILEDTKSARNWIPNCYNKNLGYLKAIISELVEWEIIPLNPAHLIKTLKEPTKGPKKTLNQDEKQLVKNHIESIIPSFWNYCLLIYHTGIRPKEALLLTNEMVDLFESKITLPASITKDDGDRIVPINKYLKNMFLLMEINRFPKHYYIFGRSDNKFNNFLPSESSLKRKYASDLWHKLVKSDLGINVDLYAFKHLGANEKILSGVSIDALKELYGHSSTLMTETYATQIKQIRQKEILENSPDF